MKKTLLTVLICLNALLCFSQTATTQTAWTKEYEENIYNQVYNTISLNFPNDSLKKQFSTCITQKLKATLPNGLASIQPDSLNRIITKVGVECRTELNSVYLTKWTPEFEIAFKKSLYERLKKSLSESVKIGLCNCMILSYKKIYPNGMPHSVPVDIENRVLGICFAELIKEGKIDPSSLTKHQK